MKLSTYSSLILLTSITQAEKVKPFPESELDSLSYLRGYEKQDIIPLECIQRQIDNGEHVFDSDGKIIYKSFPTCLETNKPLFFTYGKNEELTCTLKFEDDIYHLFQLYIHQDAPFTCRYALRPDSKLYLPLDLNFRGSVEESHFDLDPNVNVLFLNNKQNEIVASTAFSSSLNATRVIIGETIKFKFNVKWLQVAKEETDQGYHFYKLPILNSKIHLFIYCISSLLFGAILSTIFGYRRINKMVKTSQLNSDFHKAE